MRIKKKDQRGIAHHLILIGLGVVVAGAIGFAGFRIYKSKNDINAKAASYPLLMSTNNGQTVVRSCLMPTGRGEIKVITTNSSPSVVRITMGYGGTYTLNPHTSKSSILMPGSPVSFVGGPTATVKAVSTGC